jgi:hypothetical protein
MVPKMGPNPHEVFASTVLRPSTFNQARSRRGLEHLDFATRELREMKMQPSLERALRHRELLKA